MNLIAQLMYLRSYLLRPRINICSGSQLKPIIFGVEPHNSEYIDLKFQSEYIDLKCHRYPINTPITNRLTATSLEKQGTGCMQRDDDDHEPEEEEDEEVEIEEDEDGEDDEGDEDEESGDEFEDQGSDSDEDNDEEGDESEDEGDVFSNSLTGVARSAKLDAMEKDGSLALQKNLHVDDLSSDDEDQDVNTIGNVPLRWYDEEKHIGYDRTGEKIARPKGKSGIDSAIAAQDDPNWRLVTFLSPLFASASLTSLLLQPHNLRRLQRP